MSICLCLLVLSLLCLGYNYTGCHIQNPDHSTDYKWEKNQFFSTMREGYFRFRFDRNGYNIIDDTPFSQKPVDILSVGSSPMEAVQISQKANTGYLLNKLLPGMRTYNIGMSDHMIYQTIKNLRAAAKVFQPRKYVILETGIINLDEKIMREVINGVSPGCRLIIFYHPMANINSKEIYEENPAKTKSKVSIRFLICRIFCSLRCFLLLSELQ